MIIDPDKLIAVLQTAALGVAGLFVVLFVNSFFSRRISLNYEVRARRYIARKSYNLVFYFFFHAVMAIALVQMGAVVIWAGVLMGMGIVSDFVQAVLFAGSCYTTLGIVSDIAQDHWRLMPILIALSGIFSLALSTANVVGMAPMYRKAWFAKHARRVREILEAEHLDPTEVGLGYLVEDDIDRRS
mgnify:CR=1 FL=1